MRLQILLAFKQPEFEDGILNAGNKVLLKVGVPVKVNALGGEFSDLFRILCIGLAKQSLC